MIQHIHIHIHVHIHIHACFTNLLRRRHQRHHRHHRHHRRRIQFHIHIHLPTEIALQKLKLKPTSTRPNHRKDKQHIASDTVLLLSLVVRVPVPSWWFGRCSSPSWRRRAASWPRPGRRRQHRESLVLETADRNQNNRNHNHNPQSIHGETLDTYQNPSLLRPGSKPRSTG